MMETQQKTYLTNKTQTRPSFSYETTLWNKGVEYVVGIDEVGRGAFAGPLVVGAVVFPRNIDRTTDASLITFLKKINDSKLLTATQREALIPPITKFSLFHTVVTITVPVINRIGIGKANYMAMRKVTTAVREAFGENTFVLVDGFRVPYLRFFGKTKQQAIVHGDQKSVSIAAASVLAKVYRDSLMKELGKKVPLYGFADNKGYGTKTHQKALSEYGLSPFHRKSFNLDPFLPRG